MTTPTVGQRALFKAYSTNEPGFEQILKEGQLVVIDSIREDGIVVIAITEDGTQLDVDGNPLTEGAQVLADSVWESEIELIAEPELALDAEAAPAAEAAAPAMTGVDFNAMKGAELDDWASSCGVALPEGWPKMKVVDKRNFLIAWEANARMDFGTTVAAVAEAAPEAAPVAPVEAAPVPLTPTFQNTDTKGVRDLLAIKDAVQAAKELLTQVNRSNFILGGVLKRILDTGIHTRLGYTGKKGFEDFCSVELGIAYRKARYLIDTYEKFTQIGFDEDRLERIGWSKAKELARIRAEDLQRDIEGLLAYAEGHTRDELIEHVKSGYEVTQRAQTVKSTTFTFKLIEEEGEQVKAALFHAKGLSGEDDANKALLHICSDWMNTAQASDLDLEQFIALGLTRFGRDAVLAAIDTFADSEGTAIPESSVETV